MEVESVANLTIVTKVHKEVQISVKVMVVGRDAFGVEKAQCMKLIVMEMHFWINLLEVNHQEFVLLIATLCSSLLREAAV